QISTDSNMGDILPGSVLISPPKASSEVHDVGGSKLSDCWRRRSERWLNQRQGAVLLDGVGHSDILLAVGQHGFHGFPNRRAALPIPEHDRFRSMKPPVSCRRVVAMCRNSWGKSSGTPFTLIPMPMT